MKCLYARSCSCSSYLCVFGSNLTAMLVMALIRGGSSEVYESLPWTPENPMFMTNTTQCVDGKFPQMNVLPDSTFHVLCPTPVTVLETVQAIKAKHNLIENLWIIYDRESFETCNVNTTNAVLLKKKNRKLMECNKPLELKYFTIVFQQFSAVSGGLEFTPGKDYYFLATSDGTKESLNNTAGGHCNDTKNSISMRFKVHVCGENDSKCEDHTLGKLDCERVIPPTPELASTTQEISESVSPTEQTSITATTSSPSLTESTAIHPNESTTVILSTVEKLPLSSKRLGKEENFWKKVSITCICFLGIGMVAIAITIYICKRDKTADRRQAWPLRFVTIFPCCPKNNHKQVKNKAGKEFPMYGGSASNVQGNCNIAYDPDHSNDHRKEQEMGVEKDCYETIDETRSEKSTQTLTTELHSDGTESPGDASLQASEMEGSNTKPPRRLQPMIITNKLTDSVNGASDPYSRPLSTFGKDGISLGLAHKIV